MSPRPSIITESPEDSILTPRAWNALSVETQSRLVKKFSTRVSPHATEPIIIALCDMDLSPGRMVLPFILLAGVIRTSLMLLIGAYLEIRTSSPVFMPALSYSGNSVAADIRAYSFSTCASATIFPCL